MDKDSHILSSLKEVIHLAEKLEGLPGEVIIDLKAAWFDINQNIMEKYNKKAP